MDLAALGILVLTGLFAGLLGGVFGIGGGVVVVPALYAVFGPMGVPEAERIKLAVGTSLATIIVTSARSLRAHHAAGRVDWPLLRAWGPFIAAGAVAGTQVARVLSAEVLTLVFAVGILAIAVQKLAAGRGPARGDARLPGRPVQASLAGLTGLASALMGIGGGVFGVLLLTTFGRTVHVAVATAAGFGLAIAVPGAIGFALAGQGAPLGGAGAGSVGHVSLPAFAAVAVGSAITAPIGARLAHRLPEAVLTRAFAGYLLVTGALLLREAVLG